MYLEYFGLRELPFTLTPNTQFYLNLENHQEAYNLVAIALTSGEGFIKIVGEVGTGKTLLCRKLLNSLGPEYVTAYIPNPSLSAQGLQLAIAEELGAIVPPEAREHQIPQIITERLIQLALEGKRAVLVIDEAQAIADNTLEAIRLLTNLETERSKLLQIILFGQPELDRLLSQPNLRQLKQRITFSHHLRPLDLASVGRYVMHRVTSAGYNGPQLFTDAALRQIWKGSGGIPRLVNILTHKSLMAAYGEGVSMVDRHHVVRAVRDTEGAQGFRNFKLDADWIRLFAYSVAGIAGISAFAAFAHYGWLAL